ncbi:uncharacterized protein LTHEOB_4828 [Lasiodiplodia theobromae]|uniref:uncharacterized protein n=1 Tax=Lasiodiplodia theobromae TaxID=45133 RepID=UPI0015C38E32|nr:uncharacterized protein LTHEOB_4828 [Lasiodiplodia theobromae]KAF4545569.1 hypothetical protein LTHEOB_4828 [Lasiodiplodia theobromae]
MSTSLDFVVDFINTHHASLSTFAQKVDSNDLSDDAGLRKALCEHADRLKAVLAKAQCLEATLIKETDEVQKREQSYIAEVDNFKEQLEDQRRKTADANNLAEQHVKTTKLHQEKIQDLEAKYQDLQKDAHGLREQLRERDSTILTVQKDCISRLAEYMEQQPRPTLAEISSSVKDALAEQPRLSPAEVSSATKQALTDMQSTVTPIKSEMNNTTSLTLQDLQAELGRRDEALLGKVQVSVGAAIKEQSSGTSGGTRGTLNQVNGPAVRGARAQSQLPSGSGLFSSRTDATMSPWLRSGPAQIGGAANTLNSLPPKRKIDDLEHKAGQEAKRPFQNETLDGRKAIPGSTMSP